MTYSLDKDVSNQRCVGYYKGMLYTYENIFYEECRAIGLSDYNNKISENSIRKEHNLNKRIAYSVPF